MLSSSDILTPFSRFVGRRAGDEGVTAMPAALSNPRPERKRRYDVPGCQLPRFATTHDTRLPSPASSGEGPGMRAAPGLPAPTSAAALR